MEVARSLRSAAENKITILRKIKSAKYQDMSVFSALFCGKKLVERKVGSVKKLFGLEIVCTRF